MIWQLISSALLRARELYWRCVYRGYRARYDIDATFRFNGAAIQLYGDGRIQLGARSYIGELSTIQVDTDTAVTIGEGCTVSHNVRIYTVSSDADDDPRAGVPRRVTGDVHIGDAVWIGTNCFIGPGVTVGANSVIGANSVVTRGIAEGEVWGGVPARLIRRKSAREGAKRPDSGDGQPAQPSSEA